MQGILGILIKTKNHAELAMAPRIWDGYSAWLSWILDSWIQEDSANLAM